MSCVGNARASKHEQRADQLLTNVPRCLMVLVATCPEPGLCE